MNKLIAIVAAFMCCAANAAVPSIPLFASFTTDRGLREKESERYVTVYVKSSLTTDTVFFQFGENAVIDTLPVTKANTLVNIKKTGLAGANLPVKIWAPTTIWFLNINNADATSFTPGTCGVAVKEFRCENDSLNDMNFLPQMTALEYFVCSNNKRVREVTLTTPNLQRLQLGKMPGLQSITVAGPEIYEFKVDEPKITKIDFSQCPKLKTVNVSNAPNLAEAVMGVGAVLEDVTFGACTSLSSGTFENMPALKKLQIYDCTSFSNLKISNLPLLATLNLRDNALSTFSLTGFPALTALTLSGNPFTSPLDINNPSITSVTLDRCELDSVDLSKLNIVKSLYLRNGNLSRLVINEDALNGTITTMLLTNNCFGISQLPPRPAKQNTSTNYYAPQRQPQIPSVIKTGETIDLSNWATAHTLDGSVASVFKWETIFEEELVEGPDFTVVAPGKFKFNRQIEDSVRCYITNTYLPSFALLTDSKGNVTDYRIMTNYMVVEKDGMGVTDISDSCKTIVSNPSPLTISIETDGCRVRIYSVDGCQLADSVVCGNVTLTVPSCGLYVVQAGNEVFKIMVR